MRSREVSFYSSERGGAKHTQVKDMKVISSGRVRKREEPSTGVEYRDDLNTEVNTDWTAPENT